MDQPAPGLAGRMLAPVSGLLAILHAESIINRRMWITFTVIQSVLFALQVPFLLETRPFLAILAATLLADLFGGIFHIYCDHGTIRNDGSILDAQRKGFQWHHEEPNGKFEDPRPVPRLVARLQDARILLNHRAHEKHHTDPRFDGNFCIFTGHTNALLNQCWKGVRWWRGRARA